MKHTPLHHDPGLSELAFLVHPQQEQGEVVIRDHQQILCRREGE